jgi:hypothetical protein
MVVAGVVVVPLGGKSHQVSAMHSGRLNLKQR